MPYLFWINIAILALGSFLSLILVVFKKRSLPHIILAGAVLATSLEFLFYNFKIQSPGVSRLQDFFFAGNLFLSFIPLAWLLVSITYARGDYPEYLRRWRFRCGGIALLMIALHLFFFKTLNFPDRIMEDRGRYVLTLLRPAALLHCASIVVYVLALANVEKTFRSAVGTFRWKFKYFFIGFCIFCAFRIYFSSQAVIYRQMSVRIESIASFGTLTAWLLFCFALYREKLSKIDIYPSKFVIQRSITGILAGLYLIVIGLSAVRLQKAGGHSTIPLQAVMALFSILTVIILLLSDKLHSRLTRFVSRHFHRPLYDHRRIWSQCTENASSALSPQKLGKTMADLVSETFQFLSVSAWIRSDRKKSWRLLGATFREAAAPCRIEWDSAMDLDITARLLDLEGPVNLERETDSWGEWLRHGHPIKFKEGGGRFCFPIMANKELLGVLIVGDRVNNMEMTLEESELIQSMCNHTGAAILNLRLTEQLVQSRELEAFQTMATFFVHDLKNTTSTLTIMLKNFSEHIDNPEFRKDALKSLSYSVARLKALIDKIGKIREKLELHREPTDMGEFLKTALCEIVAPKNVELDCRYEPCQRVAIDRAEMEKVFVNLLNNAFDAVKPGGRVQVFLKQAGDECLLEIQDDGIGMPEEFIRNSLFKPFKTTKKTGAGVGLYHTKTIVEAHQGRIEVQSREGHGTRFTVYLPIHEANEYG